LVPRDDAKALAGCLRKLIQDPNLREQLGATGPARARTLCDPAARLQQLKNVLAEISGNGPR
jgi:glycosyltransferase involved in cell wall biosynthesis